jgi:predicted Fe-S protein YdhL (DUF1289 family)
MADGNERAGRRDDERERRRAERRRLLAAGPPSPCISVCQIDEASGYCMGCYRTIDEIRDWIILPPDERLAVMARLATRRAAKAG